MPFHTHAFFYEIDINKDVSDFLYKYTLDGLYHLEYLVGISNKKDKFTDTIEYRKKVLELIDENNNRTELYDIIQKYKSTYNISDDWINIMSKDLELITEGKQSWNWFYNKHKDDNKNNELTNIPILNIQK